MASGGSHTIVRSTVITLAVAAAALVSAHCARRPQADETRAVMGDPIDYGLGFFPEERAPDASTWRWMGPEGIIRLRNSHREMVLTIAGRFPERGAQPSAMDGEFNDEPLDPLPAATRDAERQYVIPAEKQGAAEWSRLLLTAHAVFVPHQLDPRSPDRRELAFMVRRVSWQPRPAVAASGPPARADVPPPSRRPRS